MKIGNNQYSAEVIIGFTGGNNMLLYDIINLKSTSFTIKRQTQVPPNKKQILRTVD